MENKIKQLEGENKLLKSTLEDAGIGTKNEVSEDDEYSGEDEYSEEEEEDNVDDELVIKGEETFKLDSVINFSDPYIGRECNELNTLIEKWLLPGNKKIQVGSVTNFMRKLLSHSKAYMEHRYSSDIRLHDVLLSSRGLGYVVAESEHDPLLQYKNKEHRTLYITPLEICTLNKAIREEETKKSSYRKFYQHGCTTVPTHTEILRKAHVALTFAEDFVGDPSDDSEIESRDQITIIRLQQKESLRRLKFDFALLSQEKKELFVNPRFELDCFAFREMIVQLMMKKNLGFGLTISRSAMNLMQRLVEMEVFHSV